MSELIPRGRASLCRATSSDGLLHLLPPFSGTLFASFCRALAFWVAWGRRFALCRPWLLVSTFLDTVLQVVRGGGIVRFAAAAPRWQLAIESRSTAHCLGQRHQVRQLADGERTALFGAVERGPQCLGVLLSHQEKVACSCDVLAPHRSDQGPELAGAPPGKDADRQPR